MSDDDEIRPDSPNDASESGGQAADGGNRGIGFAGDQRVIERPIDRELHESYLTYAMSTIMDRALPDVRAVSYTHLTLPTTPYV